MFDFDAVVLADLLPHGSPMCTIDQVVRHDELHLVALTQQHRDLNCVLRHAGRLSPYAGVEIAAQAAALHAAAVDPQAVTQRKVMGAVRNLEIATELDDLAGIPQALHVAVALVQANESTVIYAFSIQAEKRELVSGKMTLIASNQTFA